VAAPERFALWMNSHRHVGKHGHVYCYHPRSNQHSLVLCEYILEDLVHDCDVLQEQAAQGLVAYGVDLKHIWKNSNKAKTIDLAVGIPKEAPIEPWGSIAKVKDLKEVLISCEAKSCMTEHGKSQPRIFDELSSSHEIVHKGHDYAIAAGIAVVNIAAQFASPLRQGSTNDICFSNHIQPRVTERMVEHLRGLPLRARVEDVGFDAYCTVVRNCDNIHGATLWDDPPAPQPGDWDHYNTFLQRISQFYEERFSNLS
jgi:hypothetical protein